MKANNNMSEENKQTDPVKEQVASLLQDFREGAKDVSSFVKENTAKAVNVVQEQAPDVARQLLWYNAIPEVSKGLVAGFWVLALSLIGYKVYKEASKWLRELFSKGEVGEHPEIIVLIFPAVLIPSILCLNLGTFINTVACLCQYIFSPKIVLARSLLQLFK